MFLKRNFAKPSWPQKHVASISTPAAGSDVEARRDEESGDVIELSR